MTDVEVHMGVVEGENCGGVHDVGRTGVRHVLVPVVQAGVRSVHGGGHAGAHPALELVERAGVHAGGHCCRH